MNIASYILLLGVSAGSSLHTNVMVIVFVAVVSIVVGAAVANFSRMRGFLAGRPAKLFRATGIDEKAAAAISRELRKISSSSGSQKQTVEAISNILSEELERKVNTINKQLNEEYGKVIERNKRTTEIIRKKYEKISAEKKQTEAIIRSIAEGLVVVNDKGEVLLMNPAAEKLLGVEKEEKVGKSILEDLKKEQLISLVKTKDKEDGEDMDMEISSGEEETKKMLRASTAIIENEYGKTMGMVSVLTDVTKQRELDQLKANFLSEISHELRTPIVTVQNSLILLLEKEIGDLNESQERFLTIAQRNLKRLGRLIDDLLDLSKLEASKMDMEFESSSVETIINEVCDNLFAWAKTKSIKIERKIQKNIPKIDLDPNRIIQVLNNIIGNAVKFTPQNGRITVEAKIDEGHKNVIVSVDDNGVGIAQEDLEKIFDKFQQAGERIATDISGTGLGLSISKEIIELHGGKIWAENKKGEGVKFIFTLPVNKS